MIFRRQFVCFLCFAISFSLCNIYRRNPWVCSLHWNVYFTSKTISKMGCASVCSRSGHCTKFAWNSITGDCFLHSEEQPRVLSELPEDLVWYGRYPGNNVCQKDGYDYDFHMNTCIRFANVTASPVTWTSARATCQDEGSDLITITTREKSVFVLNCLKCFEDHIKAWIGARNRTWLTGEPLNGTIFEAVQLNDRDSHYPNDTDMTCISMRNQGNIIIDSSCNMHPFPYFMCEIVV